MFKRLGSGLLIALATLGGTAITAAAEEVEVEYDKKEDTTTVQACVEDTTLVPAIESETPIGEVQISDRTGEVNGTVAWSVDPAGTDPDGTVFGATPGSDKESVQSGKSCEGIENS